MKTAKIKIEMIEKSSDNLFGIAYNKLLLQENIDENLYEVIIENSTVSPDADSLAMILWVLYSLKLRKCWNELEDCEKRLEIGL